MHGIEKHTQSPLPNCFLINNSKNIIYEIIEWIFDKIHIPFRYCYLEVLPLYTLQCIDFSFDPIGNLYRCITPLLHYDLYSVIFWRIVAGSHLETTVKPLFHNSMHNQWRRSRSLHHQNLDSVSGKDFGKPFCTGF